MSSSTATPGQVITFYSYKGGTGRSMALANMACLLAADASDSSSVLVIDWDLEAPGVYRFFESPEERRQDESQHVHPGLLDLFIELHQAVRKLGRKDAAIDPDAIGALVEALKIKSFVVPTPVPGVELMLAGRMNGQYQSKVNALNWTVLYKRAPQIFRLLALRLAEEYRYVLIDSRTGITDTSGICTMLMPEKLVVAFTPNRQSLTGVRKLVTEATTYRRNSRDIRPLLVYPLPSRIESEREALRQMWRRGDERGDVKGYQPLFETLLKKCYQLPACDLENYFNEVQVQHSPDYAYGEQIAVLRETMEDRFSLSRSYRAFSEWLRESAAPWENLVQVRARREIDALIEQETAAREAALPDVAMVEALQRRILEKCDAALGREHRAALETAERLAHTLDGRGDPAGASVLWERILTSRRSLLGDSHPAVIASASAAAATLLKLADLRARDGALEEALQLQKRSAELQALVRSASGPIAGEEGTPPALDRVAEVGAEAARNEGVSVKEGDILELVLDSGARICVVAREFVRRNEKGIAGTLASGHRLHVSDVAGQVLSTLRVLTFYSPDEETLSYASSVERPTGSSEWDPGLYRCIGDPGKFNLEPVKTNDLERSRLALIMIHGEASSTWGTFGDLWSPSRSEIGRALREQYGRGIYAFEYPSLTRHPVANAMSLLQALPAGVEVDLLTHSGGGLIGELLCRGAGTVGRQAPFDAEEIRLLDGSNGGENSGAALFSALLKDKHLRVRRHVRVACPIRGNVFIAQLERMLPIVSFLRQQSHEDSSRRANLDRLWALSLQSIHRADEVASLPGLSAMLPWSPLIRVLNNTDILLDSSLTVIAGSARFGGEVIDLARGLSATSDVDLATDEWQLTDAMFGGPERTQLALEFEYSAHGFTHFDYFADETTANCVLRALRRRDEDVSGFRVWRTPDIVRSEKQPRSRRRPIAFLVPGLMGSELTHRVDLIWPNISMLVRGGMARLHIDRPDIEARQPVSEYREFINYLAESHDVVPFPYDWRLGPEPEGDRLGRMLSTWLADAAEEGRPVRIIAHSTGGLVLRALAARHPEIWARYQLDERCRTLFVGTPHAGCYRPVEILAGKATFLRMLAVLDLEHSEMELAKIFGSFPGVLAMLPMPAAVGHETLNFFSRNAWERLASDPRLNVVIPDPKDLAQAFQSRSCIEESALAFANSICVLGQANATISDILVSDAEGGKANVIFKGTEQGDGVVTWASASLAGAPRWLMPAAHGDLLSTPEYFPALRELLEEGHTSRLGSAPPHYAADATVIDAPSERALLFPDEMILASYALGGTEGEARKLTEREVAR